MCDSGGDIGSLERDMLSEMIHRRLRRPLRTTQLDGEEEGRSQSGFTLIELTVAMFLLSIVGAMTVSILISVQNVSGITGWQSSTNANLRQLIDDVFADIETARPSMRCDVNRDEIADTTIVTTANCGTAMIESADPVLTVAAPNRVCYYSNRRDVRKSGVDNPAYAPVCVAVVGENLRLEIFPTPGNTESWNRDLNTGSNPSKIRVLGKIDRTTLDDSDLTKREGYFQFYDKTNTKMPAGSLASVSILDESGGLIPENNAYNDVERLNIKSVLIRGRIKFNGKGKGGDRWRDISYNISLRGALYAEERCARGNKNAEAAGTCVFS
jgi:prepilin-type N-terminal cleavage/methylation domain-containing protein